MELERVYPTVGKKLGFMIYLSKILNVILLILYSRQYAPKTDHIPFLLSL